MNLQLRLINGCVRYDGHIALTNYPLDWWWRLETLYDGMKYVFLVFDLGTLFR